MSKKVHKSAVTRNRIRRRLYEAVRRREDEISGAYDMVLTVYHEKVADVPSNELEKIVEKHLDSAGIISETHTT